MILGIPSRVDLIVPLADHGGGQKELAKKLDAKHAGDGIRVMDCQDVYTKAGVTLTNGCAIAICLWAGWHASIKDTSTRVGYGRIRSRSR
ncbi:MAG: hypothetical protein WDO73_25040 [Ignavibacteriota bacterium]